MRLGGGLRTFKPVNMQQRLGQLNCRLFVLLLFCEAALADAKERNATVRRCCLVEGFRGFVGRTSSGEEAHVTLQEYKGCG